MPDLSGFETLDRLKVQPELRDVPVIIVTSQILTESERSRLMEKAMGIVSKDSLGRADLAERFRLTLENAGVIIPSLEEASYDRIGTTDPQR
jgi:CheY-like chemotaxis protein